MRLRSNLIRLAATDLSNHLACRHLTSLDLSVAHGLRTAPDWRSPDLKVIQELGLRHEAAYLQSLQDAGLSFVDLRAMNEQQAISETLSCMHRGIEAIAQGSLASGRWFGRPDVLRKVAKPSRLGNWSYEVYDCKLARETKATTILQLSPHRLTPSPAPIATSAAGLPNVTTAAALTIISPWSPVLPNFSASN